MKKKPQTPLTESEILRQKAEEQLKRKSSSKTDLKRYDADAQKLIHELQVHQIELEIQNEELVQANVDKAVAAQKYIELYDFASSGYFTLSKEGKIIMLNLKGAIMLGKERQRLINNTFGLFVSHNTRPVFNNFLSKVFEDKQDESCEVTISIDDNKQPLDVILKGRVPENSEECQMTMVDITERKQNEQKLLQSDRVFNLSLDMFCIAGFDGYFKYLNPAWEKILGWSIEELLSKPWLDFVHPDDAGNTQNIKSVIVGGKEIYRFENRYICKDGSIKWFSWNSQPFPKENIIIGAVRDVTETKKTENELKKSESIQQKMVANIGDVIVIIDKNGVNRYKSPNVKKQFGWEVDELVGKSAWDKVHPDHIERAKKLLADLVQDPEKTITTELRYLRKDGEYRWIEITISNLLYDPEIDGFLGNYHDVSERKNFQEEQIKNEELLNETGRLAKIGGWELNVETMTSYPTQETKRIYGISLDSDIPKGIEGIKYYPEEAQRKLQKLVQDAIEKGTPYDIELPFINKQGKHLWVRTIGIPEKKDGKVTRLYGTIQDITERKLDEEALRSSQEMLLTSQSVANICSYSTNLIVTDIDKSHWECSPEFYKIFGIDETYPHTIEGWIGFLHPDYREDVAAYHESVVLEKKSFNREYKIIRINDGVERWVHGTGELEYDKNGNPIRMHGAIQDITEQKLAELALKESEWYLEKAQGVSKTGHYIWDLRKSSLTWSNEMFIICGVKQENGTPTPEEYINFIHEDDKHILSPEHMEIIFQKPNHELQFKIIDQSTNDVKHIYLWGETIFNNAGEPIRLIGVVQDITKQKNTEFELINAREKAEESEKQLRHISDNFVNGMIYQVAFLEENHRQFNYVSKNVEELYGCTVEEAKKDANLIYGKIHPDDIEALIEQEKVSLKKMSTFETEARTITPNGNIRWAYYISKPRIINGVVCWDGIEIDITERKQMELELIRAKEKAEESDRLKSAFLANMSHEIRTPMNGILGFTNLLREPNLTGKEQQRYIDIIQKSGDRMLTTVNDIIDISRIESGLVELSVSEVKINDKLIELYSFFTPEASKKGIQLVLNNDISEQEIKCITDLDKLNSILTNLIKNAIKYTNQGTIEFGYRIDEERGSPKLEFYVKDSGIGIPKNRQTAIFDRFVQADIEDKQANQGSGLGLTISKAYVEMLGGKLWVESEVGLGSTFYFTVEYNPVTEPKSSTKNDEQILKKDEISRKLKILVVEDDKTSQYFISIVVEDIAKEITIAISGKEAVEACRNNNDFDLILMDIRLPDMNGYEATQQIREFNKDVIIIAQTAHALTGDREKAIEAGCNDYISKPINKDELFLLIEKYINKA